jgi:hypothetical protein
VTYEVNVSTNQSFLSSNSVYKVNPNAVGKNQKDECLYVFALES